MSGKLLTIHIIAIHWQEVLVKGAPDKSLNGKDKQTTGDILDLAELGYYDLIVQGCNCYCQMGKGLALQIKQRYPEAYAADCKTIRGDISKLGTITYADTGKFLIVNAYTQYHWHGDGKQVLSRLDAIESCFKQIKQLYSGKRIGYPKIGAGLARGNWDLIYPIIKEELKGEDHTVILHPDNTPI